MGSCWLCRWLKEGRTKVQQQQQMKWTIADINKTGQIMLWQWMLAVKEAARACRHDQPLFPVHIVQTKRGIGKDYVDET